MEKYSTWKLVLTKNKILEIEKQKKAISFLLQEIIETKQEGSKCSVFKEVFKYCGNFIFYSYLFIYIQVMILHEEIQEKMVSAMLEE